MTEPESPNFYAIIPATVRYDKELKPNAKLLYAEITALTNAKGFCWASNSYFANLFGIDKLTVSRLVSQLQKKGYLEIELIYDGKQIKERRVYIQNNQGVLTKKSIPIDEKVKVPSIYNSKVNTKEIPPTPPVVAEIDPEIIKFVGDFQAKTRADHGKKAPEITKSLIKSGCETVDKLIRLDGFTLNEVKLSIAWAVTDDFWANQVYSLSALRAKSKSNGLKKFQNIYNQSQSKGKMTKTETDNANFKNPAYYGADSPITDESLF